MDCDLKPAPTHAYVCLLDSVAVVRSGMRTYHLWFISHPGVLAEIFYCRRLRACSMCIIGTYTDTMRVLVLGMTAKAGCISLICAAATPRKPLQLLSCY